jgi:signal transduction histidine kinase/ActR/RegA family two-component response regulator
MPFSKLTQRFQHLKIRHKILSLVAVFSLLLLTTSGFSLYSLMMIVKNDDVLNDEVLPAIQTIDTLNNTINHIRIKHFKYLLSTCVAEKDTIIRAEIPDLNKKRDHYIQAYGAIIRFPKEKQIYNRFRRLYTKYDQIWDQIVLLERHGRAAEAKDMMANQGRKYFLQAEAILVNISQSHIDRSVVARRNEIEFSNAAFVIVNLIDLAAMVLTVLLGLYVALQISNPIQRMTQFAEKTSNNEEVDSVPLILSRDEIGVLNKAYLMMLSKISTKNDSLEVLNQRLEADLQERKRLERQLIHAQKMEAIGTLTGGIAHDFNNLLWMILGNSEVLLELLPKESNEADIQRDILQAAERAKALVQQLLDFSRKSSSDMQDFSVRSLISEVSKQVQSRIPEHALLLTDIPESTLLVTGDPNKFHRVLTNITTNACQAIEQKSDGQVRIALSEIIMTAEDLFHFPEGAEPGLYQLLEISDNGCGMSKETIAKIFDPFFSTKTVGSGTGLGLSIAHSIIAEMKGYISAYSELGQGSTFKIFLPTVTGLSDEAKSTPAETTIIDVSSEENVQNPKNILLVDDEPLIRTMVHRMLEKLGHTVYLCENGEEGLEAVTANPTLYDLVITDQTMPYMTGIEMAQAIYTLNKDLPVIMESGNIQAISKADLENTGIRQLVSKPVQYKDLKACLEKIWNE